MKVVTIAQMRALEEHAFQEGMSSPRLMERAGLETARGVRDQLGGAAGRRIVVLVGPGNNGGDALVAARYLSDWGALPHLFLLTARAASDSNFQATQERRIPITLAGDSTYLPALQHALGQGEAVLDGVLGIGSERPLEGIFKETLELVRKGKAQRPSLQLIAVDVPTGLGADTGAADPSAFPADTTISLGAPKRGLFAFPGAALVGRLLTADIGLPLEWSADLPVTLLTAAHARSLLPGRSLDANKGTFGRVLVVAGSSNYPGAAILACRGATRAGAGLVTLAAPPSAIDAVVAAMPETTYLPLSDAPLSDVKALLPMSSYDALLVGCGLGAQPASNALVSGLLLDNPDLPPSLVIDADGLNILAGISEWWRRLSRPAVVTPHPGEMARLLNTTIPAVQQDRIATATSAAQSWGCVVVLKGAHTVIAAPDGQSLVSPFANPALATAGTGDVLAGALAGLLAQGASPFNAAGAAVYAHGLAGERFFQNHGNAGLLASELASLLPDVLTAMRQGTP